MTRTTSATDEAVSPPLSHAEQAKRDAYIDGLRQLADLLEQNPAIPTPYPGNRAYPSSIAIYDVDTREVLTDIARELRDATEQLDGDRYRVSGRLAGLHLSVTIEAKKVGRTVRRNVETFAVDPILPGVAR